MFLAQRRGVLSAKHPFTHFSELRHMLVVARLHLLQLALHLRQTLGCLLGLADALGEFSGFRFPARRLFAGVCHRAFQFGRLLIGSLHSLRQRPRVTGRRQADSAQEGTQQTHSVPILATPNIEPHLGLRPSPLGLGYHAGQMNDPDAGRRLETLIAALAPMPIARATSGADDDGPTEAGHAASGGDAQRIATIQIDELVRRISVLTGILGGADGTGWDDVDQLAAQLLISDLSTVTATTRALNELTASRLATALAELQSAGVDVQRAVKEAAGS